MSVCAATKNFFNLHDSFALEMSLIELETGMSGVHAASRSKFRKERS